MTQPVALHHFLVRPLTHAAAHRWVAPVAVSLVNLWFGGTMEPSLRQNQIGFLLYLLTECGAAVVVTSAVYFSTIEKVLLRLRLYPVTPRVRMGFTLMGLFRSPAILALIVSAAGIPVVILFGSFPAAIAAAILTATVTVCTVTGTAMVFLIGTNHHLPPGAYLIAVAGLCGAAVVASIPQGGSVGILAAMPALLPGVHGVPSDTAMFAPAIGTVCIAILSAAALIAAGRRHG